LHFDKQLNREKKEAKEPHFMPKQNKTSSTQRNNFNVIDQLSVSPGEETEEEKPRL